MAPHQVWCGAEIVALAYSAGYRGMIKGTALGPVLDGGVCLDKRIPTSSRVLLRLVRMAEFAWLAFIDFTTDSNFARMLSRISKSVFLGIVPPRKE